MLNLIKKLSFNLGFMVLLGFILGFLTGGVPRYTNIIIIISLLILMSLSTRKVKISHIRGVKGHLKDFFIAFILNYGVLSITVVALAFFLFKDMLFIKGMVAYAVAPPAIGVIAFTAMVKGDTELSLISTSLMYILSVIIVPVILYLSFGSQIGIYPILQKILLLILIPFIISRILLKVGYDEREYDNAFINFSLFLLTFAVIGANRNMFFYEPLLLIPIIIVGVIRTFGIGTLTLLIGKWSNIKYEKLKSYVLFAVYKNSALGIIFATTLFGIRASVPLVVGGLPIGLPFLIYYEKILKEKLILK